MDLLVKLYDLPRRDSYASVLSEHGVTLRRPRAYEKSQVLNWVAANFSVGWRDECEVTFSRQPVSSFIATKNGELIGFGCYETTYRNFAGPLGMAKPYRGKRIGIALLFSCLHAMADIGYAYAIIGGPIEAAPIYVHALGAIEIPDSDTGIYVDRLHGRDS
jgi:hypothetical protein